MDDIAAYGYITPLKVKIVLALPLTDSVVRDAEVIMVCPLLFISFPDTDVRRRPSRPSIWLTITPLRTPFSGFIIHHPAWGAPSGSASGRK